MPVASVGGFEVGQKIGIGYGATYPIVANTIEKYEIVTVTEVGKQGIQAFLAADAKAGDTNIKVYPLRGALSDYVTVGDKIRLDIDSLGHGIETVTVTKVGTQSAFNPNNVRSGDTGTGLDLAEPLKFNHASNLPISIWGTGISFEPATKFAHSSNEPVLPLNRSITLDRALDKDHEIDTVVYDEIVTTAGYQGSQKPNQWFGGPALSNSGSIVLRNASGLVADSLNYGGHVDPWAGEGYQAISGSGQSGCTSPAPTAGFGGRGGFGGFGGRGGMGAETVAQAIPPARSAGRFPDGMDTDSNCNDFLLQTSSVALSLASAAGSNNIKVASVSGFGAGQKILIDSDGNKETAVIATVGTAGGTNISAAAEAGATVITVANVDGFNVGQAITIDSGAKLENAMIASVSNGRGRGNRGGFGGGTRGGTRGGQTTQSPVTITLAAPLKSSHAVGTQVSGSGITLVGKLTKAHDTGILVSGSEPTPGAPNQYFR